ncbi:hypothetical protein LGH82_05150 [Mesorhizobium sp. PAMC28654]|uniref:hypothetical protein n=1 Tax=Mesorhizobium sp. PAMC28654 TaxID=2880934 RepID=UPI001D0BA154|nr:hypothetical protein [Mesorhizobium sp. PAMC28654]UDL90714.1 hypothetical protein LGH82_05150 [Mesorhizobium sp. PAMC28654]
MAISFKTAAEVLYVPTVILLVEASAVLAPNQTDRRKPINGPDDLSASCQVELAMSHQ